MGFLMWLEQTGLATFVRDSPIGYWTFLFVHTLGLAIVVGASTVVAVRVLGLALSIPLAPLERLFPMMWLGFGINAISGACLFAANASNQIVNPFFLIKMVFIAFAVANMWLLKKKVFRAAQGAAPHAGKILAGTLLVLWLGSTIAGRLIAYSS